MSALILHNSNHRLIPVVEQVMKVTNLDFPEAHYKVLQLNQVQKVKILDDSLSKCMEAEAVLKEYGLKTSIE
jgi:hypothetical protein